MAWRLASCLLAWTCLALVGGLLGEIEGSGREWKGGMEWGGMGRHGTARQMDRGKIIAYKQR